MNYGQKIAELRKSNKLTQAELGEKLNITAQAVSKWENNLSEPDIDSIRRMCEIFEVSVDDFLGVEPKKKEQINDTAKPTEEQAPRIINGYCEKCSKPVGPGEYKIAFLSYNPSALVDKIKTTKEQHIYCNDCHKAITIEKQKRDREIAVTKALQKKADDKRRLLKGIIWGIVFLAIGAALGFGAYAMYPVSACLVGAIILTVGGFTAASQFCWGDFIEDVFLFFCRSFRAPFGLIFELSLDGIIWLLTVKLCLWILCGMLSILWFFVGLVVTASVSIVTFPYAIVKACKGNFDD